MKTFKNIAAGTAAILAFLFIQINTVSAQDSKKDKAEAVKNMVKAKNFVFKADYVIPMRGTSRNLTSDYDLNVSKDTITAYLPYFGRAYSAPIDPTEGGIKFTSTDFKYETKPKRKGGWEISIEPKDTRDVRQLTMDISESGYASLRIISNNREAISFNGYIKEKGKK